MAMTLSVPNPQQVELRPRIVVIGVGGAGGNAVNNMIRANLTGIDFIACNTDSQALGMSLAERRIQLGNGITRGLGAGCRPEVGRAAAEETLDEIVSAIQGSNMVFITGGMGGGTGTGSAPVIARAAREQGILTVGVVTKPFQFEGSQRMRVAEGGIQDLQQYVDTLIVIPNQNLFRLANERTTFADAFKMADDVLQAGVRGVTDLMVMPGLINLDFADVRAVMSEMGKAMMGTGEAVGDRRALDAAEAAISNPLLEDTSMKGARGVLINVMGGYDMTLFEVDEAANRIRAEVDPEANIIFGSTFDETLDGRMRVSVVATGIDVESQSESLRRPQISLVHDRARPHPTAPALPQSSGLPPQMVAPGGNGGGQQAYAQQAEPVGGGLSYPTQGGTALQPQVLPQSGYTQPTAAPPRPAPAASPPQPQSYAPRPAPVQRPPVPSRADVQGRASGATQPHGYAPHAQQPHGPQGYSAPPAPAVPHGRSQQDQPFIPPAPVDPSRDAIAHGMAPVPSAQPQPQRIADPFVEAEVTNGGRAAAPHPQYLQAPAPQASAGGYSPQSQAASKPRVPSLFEKVTGVAAGMVRPKAPPTTGPVPAPQARSPEPHFNQGGAAPQVNPPTMPRIEAGDRTAHGGGDDDLLDIPAFLRRQAN